MINLSNITIQQFRDFVGDGIFTAVFRKKSGEVRTMNARIKVQKYVKGTAPEVTAKRKETLTKQNMIGVYEMKGTSDRIGAENYRTINLETLIELRANGQVLVNDLLNRPMTERWEGVFKK